MSGGITHVKSVKFGRKKPVLSVLIPYYHDDPSDLLAALLQQAEILGTVEILFYDDGTGDTDLNAKLCALIKPAPSPVCLMIADVNKGRSAARNSLQKQARADWVLFLDADMRPSNADFLQNYVALIGEDVADIIFGGFLVPERAESPDRELHRALSEISDCLSLPARQDRGAQYVASSNLCVRRSVLEAEQFDDGFVGWGWEDSEWAARVSKSFTLVHAEIPALHLGLETTDTLLKRFATSGANYVRFAKT